MRWLVDTRLWLGAHRRASVQIALSLLLIALVVDGVWIEPRRLELTTYNVSVPNLPQQLDGFRIVQLSDLHRKRIVPDSIIQSAVDLANTTNADAAFLTGDFISNTPANAEPSCEMLAKLRTRLGSFAVLGNHDHTHGEGVIRDSLARNGIRLLDNESAQIASGLYFVGIDDYTIGRPDLPSAFGQVPPNAARVIMTHNPDLAPAMGGYTGLMITGHIHGGQICLPFFKAGNIAGLFGWPYIKGWYTVGGILMYVNRGIGTTGIPARLFCRPEVTLYILHPGGSLAESRE